jgi:hypothetical protein
MGRLMMAMAILLGSVTAPLAAPVFDDPKALIDYAYAPYLEESAPFPDDPSELYSPTLKQLWDDASAKSEESEVPIIDFDPLINAQDYEISDFVVADPRSRGDAATVVGVVQQSRRAAGTAFRADPRAPTAGRSTTSKSIG